MADPYEEGRNHANMSGGGYPDDFNANTRFRRGQIDAEVEQIWERTRKIKAAFTPSNQTSAWPNNAKMGQHASASIPRFTGIPKPPTSFQPPYVPPARKPSGGSIFLSIICALFTALVFDIVAVVGFHATRDSLLLPIGAGLLIGWMLPSWLPPLVLFFWVLVKVAFVAAIVGIIGYVAYVVIAHVR